MVFGEMAFGSTQFREDDVRVIDIFRENGVPLNNDSWKWPSAIRQFGKITFGWKTIRGKCHSALWSFGNSTIRLCDDLVKLLSLMFFFPARQRFGHMFFLAKQRFGKIMFRDNDVAWSVAAYLIFYPSERESWPIVRFCSLWGYEIAKKRSLVLRKQTNVTSCWKRDKVNIWYVVRLVALSATVGDYSREAIARAYDSTRPKE